MGDEVEITVSGRARYRLRATERSSRELGNCGICGTWAADVYLRCDEVLTPDLVDGGDFWRPLEPRRFGHRGCLAAAEPLVDRGLRDRALAIADGEERVFDVRLPDAPVQPGSCALTWTTREGEHAAWDDGRGHWLWRAGERMDTLSGPRPTIDYRTGRVVVYTVAPPLEDSEVRLQYRVQPPETGA